MADELPVPGGSLEYAVLLVLWEEERLTARQIHDRIGTSGELVHTTITRVLDRLLLKGLVQRRRRDSVFVYRPVLSRASVDRERFSRTLTEMLRGEPRPALASLVEAVEGIDPRLLDELSQLVDARRKAR